MDQTISERFLHQGNAPCNGCTLGNFGFDNGLAGMAYEERNFSSSGQLVTKKLTAWTKKAFPTGGVSADWHPRITHEESFIYDADGNGVSATVRYDYEGDLNLRESPVLVNKTTQYAFAAIPGSLLNLPDPDEEPDPNPTPVPTPIPSSLTPVKIVETAYLINVSRILSEQVKQRYGRQMFMTNQAV